MSAYDEATDCPICPMLATDRDDALEELRAHTAECEHYDEQLENADKVIAAARAVVVRFSPLYVNWTPPQVLDLADALAEFDRRVA